LAAHNPEFPGWTPVTVKLFQSPGKAGGFPGLVKEHDLPLFTRRLHHQKISIQQ
jgi:hypothetical protein